MVMDKMRFEAKKNWMGPGWHVIDTETGRMVFEIAWIYDKEKGENAPNEERANLFADALNGKFQDEIAKLKTAILQTLDDNAHLADGETCTLFTLKAVLRELGCPWDGDEKSDALNKHFEPGEIVVVSDFKSKPEEIGVEAEFIGMTDDGMFLAKSTATGKYININPVRWKYCFRKSDINKTS